MKPEDWQKAKSIFNAALDRPVDVRPNFVADMCGHDEELRLKVEELLGSFDPNFLENSVIDQSGSKDHGTSARWRSGETVGKFTIVGKLGEGGMGEVYVARDENLGRRVAIKVLNEKFGEDEASIKRFVQEAKAASALDHPNILVIHEVGETNGLSFIVSEFIDGKTLREVIARGGLRVSEILDIAIQIASALAAAHSARIIHRDIKPENVVIRADGYVKVLDFGLAKLLPERFSFVDADDKTFEKSLTDSGLILGTVSYMSPEQAKGEKVDERTDIFSLGIVIAEMVTGQTPFAADSTPEALANLIFKEPPPLSQFVDVVPGDLQRIVSKTLRKDRDNRYQTMKGLLADLKELKAALDFEAKLGRAATERIERRIPTGAQAYERNTTELRMIQSDSLAKAPAAFSISAFGSASAMRVAAAVVLLVMAFLGIGYAVYRLAFLEAIRPGPFQDFTVSRATNEGNVLSAAISKDGRYIAYTTVDGSNYNLWTKHLATNSRVQIASPPGVIDLFALDFSPDGGYVLYTVLEPDRPAGYDLYQVPVLGGVSRKIISGIGPVASISPDGQNLAFVRQNSQTLDMSLAITGIDGTSERVVAEAKFPEQIGVYGASWSPDSTMLATAHSDSGLSMTAVSINAGDGQRSLLSSKVFNFIGAIRWLPAENGVVLVAQEEASATNKLWHIRVPGGEARLISRDLDSYLESSLMPTGDGASILAVKQPWSYSVYVSEVGNLSAVRRISTRAGLNNGVWGLSWDSKGGLYSVSQDENKSETWLMEPNSEMPKVIMVESAIDSVSVTPDGRNLVFISKRSGEWQIWRTDITGNEAKQLTPAGTSVVPGMSVSPDGRTVLFSGLDGTIWSVPFDGGELVKLAKTPKISYFPQISPDGRFLACQGWDDQIRARIFVFSVDDGTAKHYRTLDLPPTYAMNFHWAIDGRSFVYLDTVGRVTNLWQLPLSGGKAKQLTNFNSEIIKNFAFSPDGERLALSRGPFTSDAVLITRAE